MSFGRLRESRIEPKAEINMIPLIDVMLVLLVIFILTAPLVTQSVKLQLPETVDLKEKQISQEEERPIVIAINEKLEIHINDELVSQDQIISRLSLLKVENKASKIPMVQLHIDAQVPYEEVAKIIADLSKVGLPNIGFVSLPEANETGK